MSYEQEQIRLQKLLQASFIFVWHPYIVKTVNIFRKFYQMKKIHLPIQGKMNTILAIMNLHQLIQIAQRRKILQKRNVA